MISLTLALTSCSTLEFAKGQRQIFFEYVCMLFSPDARLFFFVWGEGTHRHRRLFFLSWDTHPMHRCVKTNRKQGETRWKDILVIPLRRAHYEEECPRHLDMGSIWTKG